MSRFGLRTRPGLVTATLLGNHTRFLPTDIPSLRLWLDANDESTITHSNGSVSQWTSKDANAREFVQATGSAQPTTGSTTLNGRNTLDFNADWLVTNAPKSAFNYLHSQKSATFIVMKVGNVAEYAERRTFAGAAGASGNNRGIWWFYDSDRTIFQVVRQATGGTINTSSVDFFPSNEYAILRVEHDPANATVAERLAMWRNAADAQKNNANSQTTHTGDSTYDLNIGRDGLNADTAFIGQIAEIISYERDLTAQEVEDVEGYLAAKWGITLS